MPSGTPRVRSRTPASTSARTRSRRRTPPSPRPPSRPPRPRAAARPRSPTSACRRAPPGPISRSASSGRPPPTPGSAATRRSAATPRRTCRYVAQFAISGPARCRREQMSNTDGMDLPTLPRPLRAPDPGCAETTDVVVVGSGLAGLTAALDLRAAGLHVTVVTKVNIDDGSTRWAQGGIAAVLGPLDTPGAHAEDTLVAGVGLSDPAAVEVLVTEGPARVRELMRWGAEFDRYPDGTLMLTREGGHHADRVVHAGGDATGAEVQRALHDAVRREPRDRPGADAPLPHPTTHPSRPAP